MSGILRGLLEAGGGEGARLPDLMIYSTILLLLYCIFFTKCKS
jgi:hypothetical protein